MAALGDLIDALRLDRTRSAWSRSQTLDDALRKLKGEIDECREALAHGDEAALIEELGDALWSVIFALIVAQDERGLSLEQVAAAAHAKLKFRKPWLFNGGPPLSLEQEALLWARAKERQQSGEG